jgi:hypothetical protein
MANPTPSIAGDGCGPAMSQCWTAPGECGMWRGAVPCYAH